MPSSGEIWRNMECDKFESLNIEEFKKISETSTNEDVAEHYSVDTKTIRKWRMKLGMGHKRHKYLDHLSKTLSERQKSILLGSMLGDGCLGSIDSANHSRFQEGHGAAQEEYLRWKHKEMLPFSLSFQKRNTFGRMRSLDGKWIKNKDKNSVEYYFNTMIHPVFTSLEKQWYARDVCGNYMFDRKGWRIKVIPKDIELDELSVAIWYFDDGTHNARKQSSIVFNTHSFTQEECEFLRQQLKNMGFGAKIHETYGKFIIRLFDEYYLKFMQMASKYLPCQSMAYKVDISNYDFKKQRRHSTKNI